MSHCIRDRHGPHRIRGRRDAKIERAALAVDGVTGCPRMAMGDFNDVAWSHTTQLFKRVGGFFDPRVGPGQLCDVPGGSHVAVGWPLDQLFATPAFTFRRVKVLENVGSDHRPLSAELCLTDHDVDASAADRGARAKARGAVQTIR